MIIATVTYKAKMILTPVRECRVSASLEVGLLVDVLLVLVLVVDALLGDSLLVSVDVLLAPVDVLLGVPSIPPFTPTGTMPLSALAAAALNTSRVSRSFLLRNTQIVSMIELIIFRIVILTVG
jgi:hypothetical protein